MKYNNKAYRTILLLLTFLICANTLAQMRTIPDTTIIFTPSNPNLIRPQSYRPLTSAWGLDLLMSNNGFGFGAFYRYEMTDDLSLMLNFTISDVKDDAEFEMYNPYTGQPFVPGKKNRLLLMPLIASVQYRLFKDDILDNFRPFVTAGLGPTMVFVAPYVLDRIQYDAPYALGPIPYKEKIDFFSSLKYGKLRYTLGGFVGAGAFFGMEKGTLTGLCVRYFLAPFPDGIEIMEGGYIRNFGGLFITLTFGAMF